MAKSKQSPLRLEYRNASELADNPANWRKHPAKQINALRDVLAEVGWAGVVLFNERTEHLIDGHARKQISGDDRIPVLIGSWTEEQEKKILATLDPLGALATADTDKLEGLLRQVNTDSEHVRALLLGLASQNGIQGLLPNTIQDEIPAPLDKAVTKPGDLWQLGKHRLLCADSGNPKDVDRLLDGAPVHATITDPPYNVQLESRSNNSIAAGANSFAGTKHHQQYDLERHPEKSKPTSKKMRPKDRPLMNDFVSEEEFDEMLLRWFGNIGRVLLPGRLFFIFGGYSNIANYPHALKASGLYFSQQVIWHKMHPVLSRKCFLGDHEWCFFGWREGAAHQFFGPPNVSDVWTVKKISPQSMVHLTEKPVELATRAIDYSSRPGENILDLFGGSGWTLMAAEQTGRRAFLMELDALYCDVIVERWERFTGGKARRTGRARTVQDRPRRGRKANVDQ